MAGHGRLAAGGLGGEAPAAEAVPGRLRRGRSAWQDSVMSLPASQWRALNQIEKTLASDHPGLGPLFAVFTRLTGHEAMPVTERGTGWPWWRMWPGAVATGHCPYSA
jgi:hypothetical protein